MTELLNQRYLQLVVLVVKLLSPFAAFMVGDNRTGDEAIALRPGLATLPDLVRLSQVLFEIRATTLVVVTGAAVLDFAVIPIGGSVFGVIFRAFLVPALALLMIYVVKDEFADRAVRRARSHPGSPMRLSALMLPNVYEFAATVALAVALGVWA